MPTLPDFLRESNLIEGITREHAAFQIELAAASRFLEAPTLLVQTLCDLQAVLAPGEPLRERKGQDVQVGGYVAPPGGPNIRSRLEIILHRAATDDNPWHTHCRYEMLHPFMDGNGRTGRMLWAWHMRRLGRDPFALPFLHRFYYQTLENSR